MIELHSNKLAVSFPELPMKPELTIDFQRTLRIPDDGREYALPPGLGSFPVRHIDDFAPRVPRQWLSRGGVIMPMWQSEALWLNFSCDYPEQLEAQYPFAVKIATGKISALTGEAWRSGLERSPQNYLVAPQQPWLDGFCVKKGIIRQFVAMPLGEGYSAEEQITGAAEFGGIQIEVFPMRAEVFEKKFPRRKQLHLKRNRMCQICEDAAPGYSMGLAPGGRMRQEIYADPFSIHEWDMEHTSRCFVHLVNSATWQSITGQRPPSTPPTPRQYANAGYPWFDYYDAELTALDGSAVLAGVKSVKEMTQAKGVNPPPHNETVKVTNLVNLRPGLSATQVRETDAF